MKPTRSLYYPDTTPTVKATDTEWWLSQDIQKEVLKRSSKYVSLSKIGRIANEYGLAKKTTFGFKLYHKKLVDILCDT